MTPVCDLLMLRSHVKVALQNGKLMISKGKFSERTAMAIVIANMIGTGIFTSLGFQLADFSHHFGGQLSGFGHQSRTSSRSRARTASRHRPIQITRGVPSNWFQNNQRYRRFARGSMYSATRNPPANWSQRPVQSLSRHPPRLHLLPACPQGLIQFCVR